MSETASSARRSTGNTPQTKRAAERAAARTKLVIDKRLGRTSDPRITALAHEPDED